MDQAGLKKTFEGLNKSIAVLKDEAKKTSQEYMKEAFINFFTKTPEVQLVTWQQYTPYFNDGDSCKFSVNDPNFYKDSDERDEDVLKGGYFEPFKKPGQWVYDNRATSPSYERQIQDYDATVAAAGPERVEEIRASIKEIKSLFKEIKDEYFEMMFGGHAQVDATAAGFDVNEYQHD